MSQYATIAELYLYGAPSTVFGGLASTVLDDALQAASGRVDSALRTHRANSQLPMTVWGADVRQAVCKLATYEVLSVRGLNPAAGSDANIRMRYDDAERWIRGVARGEIHLDVTPALTSPSQGSAQVLSNTRRGW